MADIIDSTYFIREINIPDSSFSALNSYISRYGKGVLQKLLGYELWVLVNAYSSGTPGVVKNFVEGKEYEAFTGETIKWNGLINTDKISLMAYYVYYYWIRSKSTTLQTTGAMKLKSENAVAGSPVLKVSQAWSELETLYGFPGQSKYVASAYNFLAAHESDYPDWIFSRVGSVNAFDL